MPRLAELVRAKYPGSYDDLSDEQLESAVKAKYPGVYDDLAAPEDGMLAKAGHFVTENLPAIGGTIGGIVGMAGGPVVAAGTAALGGAAGRLGQRALQGDVKNLGEMAMDAGTEGAIQGATEAVGGVAGKALTAGGARLYKGLLKPSKNLVREFPDVVDTLIKVKAPISGKGERMVQGALDQSTAKAEQIIKQAAPTAPPIRASEIVPEFADTVKELRGRVDIGQPSALGAVGERGRNLMKADRGLGFDLERAQELKKVAQNSASAGYRQAERGAVKEVTPDTMLDKDVARGFRKAIEQRVPEVAPVNAQTQRLTGGARALEDAIHRETNTHGIGGAKEFISAGVGGAALGAGADTKDAIGLGLLVRILATPSLGSRAAIQAVRAGQIAPQAVPALLRLLRPSHEQTAP